MSRRTLLVAASAITTVASTLVLSSLPANAADPDPNAPYAYSGSAGGTYIRVLGGAVRSDLTSASGVSGATYPAQNANTLASVHVEGLLDVGAVSTDASATKTGTTITQKSHAEIAGVSVLGGLIKADALDTTTSATRTGTVLSGSGNTDFAKITVAGATIPLTVPRNFNVTIPGVASVVLNENKTTIDGDKVSTEGSAIKVTLLAPAAGSPIGTTIIINPTNSKLTPAIPSNATPVGGYAYGTYVTAGVGSAIRVVSGPTAQVSASPGGSGGYTLTNSTLAVDLLTLISAGVVESTSNSTSVPTTADVTHTNEVGRIKLLNGLITADAVKVTAHVQKLADGTIIREPSTQLVNLKILGLPIKVNVAPNTSLTIPGVAKVTLNEQVTTASRTTVTGLHITLVVPLAGLPAGAEIQVAVASSWVG